MVVAGDSAGGGLAVALMLRLQDSSLPLPLRAALFYPWTDLAATSDTIRANTRRDAMFEGSGIAGASAAYVGNSDVPDPLISPLYADLAGLPPLLIHAGKGEVLQDGSTRPVSCGARLANHNRVYPGRPAFAGGCGPLPAR